MSGQVPMVDVAGGTPPAWGRESAVPGDVAGGHRAQAGGGTPGAAPGEGLPLSGPAEPAHPRAGSGPRTAATAAETGRESARPGLGRLRRAPSWAAGRSGGDPLGELVERVGDACAGAVHAEEVAALLESEGLTDELITGRYGQRDLFSLAEALYARVPRAFPEPEPEPDPWRTGLGRCVLRGLTFALPGVGYVLGGRWAGGPDGPFGVTAAVAGWALAALVSWGWNQGLAHRAGLLLLAQRPRSAARCLLAGGALGTVPATAAALALTGPGHPAPPLFAFGQALYMAAATAVLVLGRERLLLYVLGPLTVAAACGAAGLPSPVVASVLGTTVAGAVAAAVLTARQAARQDEQPPGTREPAGSPFQDGGSPAWRGFAALGRFGRGKGRRYAAREPAPDGGPRVRVPVRRSVPLALGGLAAGVLVVAAALAGELVAALSVSMGVAEWLLFRFRGRCLLALRGTGVAERLLARSWRVLARCLGGYAAALVALAAVESAALPGAPAWDLPHLGVLLGLGCALWLALLLQSCGRPWTAAGVLTCAAATALTLLAAHAGTPGAVLGLTGAGAALVLLTAATTVTARVTTHR